MLRKIQNIPCALVTVTLSGASGTSVRVFDATGAFQDLVRVTIIIGG